MLFNVPVDNLSSTPISYHLARVSYKAPLTSLKLSGVSCPEMVCTVHTMFRFKPGGDRLRHVNKSLMDCTTCRASFYL